MKTFSVSLVVVCSLGIGVHAPAGEADQPPQASKQESKQQPAVPAGHEREYLPALLQKALLATEQTEMHRLQEMQKLATAFWEGGDATMVQVEDVEAALIELRISALKHEVRYRDLLDQLRAGFDIPSTVPKLLNAERALLRAQEQILTTWLNYQTARLDLCGRLGIRK